MERLEISQDFRKQRLASRYKLIPFHLKKIGPFKKYERESMIRIRQVTDSEKEKAYKLRYDAYVVQDCKYSTGKFPDRLITNQFDEQEDTIILLAEAISGGGNPEAVGTIALYRYRRELGGLPIMQTIKGVYDLDRLLERRKYKTPLWSCGMLAIDQKYHRSAGLLIWLYKMLFELGGRQRVEDFVATINYKIEPMMSKIGLEHLVSDKWYSEEIDNYLYLLYGEYEKIKSNLIIDALPAYGTIFLDSREVWIGRREDFIRQGETGGKAFFLIEGTADVVVRTSDSSFRLNTLYPGETFGEMALFENEKRTATVTASCLAVAKVVRRETYARHLKNREEALALIKSLITRLKEMNRRVSAEFRFRNSIRQPLFPIEKMQTLPDIHFNPGDIVCHQGDSGDEAYAIMDGQFSVAVANDDQPMKKINSITVGSTFGYLSVLATDNRRTATVIAESPATVKRISRADFFNLLDDAEVRENVIRELFEILSRMNRYLSADAGRERIFFNLKRLLYAYFQKAPIREYFDDIPLLTSEWIAHELGITENQASDLLKQLTNKGILEKTQTGYELVNLEKLLYFQFRTGFRPRRPSDTVMIAKTDQAG
jgi:CRP/FNR family transcriptional regulator, cyclic AMP receptor protein